MSFWNSFTHGFAHGAFNSMFGGWGMNCCGWTMPCCNQTPLFFTPSLFMGGFNRYAQPMVNVPQLPMLTFTPVNMNFGGNTFNYSMEQIPDFTKIKFGSSDGIFSSQSMPEYSYNGDSFLSTTKIKKKEKEDKKVDTNFTYDAKELKAKWDKKKSGLSPEFYQKVVDIAKKVNCSPNDLMGVMNAESSLNSSAENSIGAVGLIQFIPSTAKGFGVTKEQLKNMTPERQLDYVEQFLVKAKGNAGFAESDKIDSGTLYSLVFLPKYARNEVLTSSGEKAYDQNKGLDVDKDGKITKSDLAKWVERKSA